MSQKWISKSQKLLVVPSERSNILLLGDFNINLVNAKDPKVVLLRNLAKQFQLPIHEPNSCTRKDAKLDFVVVGRGITIHPLDQIKANSDHDIVRWEVTLQATKKPRDVVILNKKLGEEITASSVLDNEVTNAFELLQKFLWHRKLRRRQAQIRIKPRQMRTDVFKDILMAVQDEDIIINDINKYWENFWNDQE